MYLVYDFSNKYISQHNRSSKWKFVTVYFLSKLIEIEQDLLKLLQIKQIGACVAHGIKETIEQDVL